MANSKVKIIRAVTVPQSLSFCSGIMSHLATTKGYEMVALSSPGHELDSFCAKEDVRGIAVPMNRHISIRSDLKSLWQLVKVFRRERPTMVHSMTPKAGLLCMMAAWLTRVPVRVHTFTGLVFPTAKGLTRKILMLTDSLTCACSTHIIPEGEGVKRDLLDNGITRKQISVLGHGNVRGIDLTRFDRTPEVMAEAAKIRRDDKFTFIAIGRIVGDKGINELVEAFVRLNKEYPDTLLILVGRQEADLDPVRQDTADIISTHPDIISAGQQSDVRPWLAASDCHILASYREGFPNVVIEAGAMGLPQIVTDINGANEIVVPPINGTIVAPRDADALYRAMNRLLHDPAMRQRQARDARTMIADRYEQSYVRRCLYNFYDQILRPFQS